MTKILTTVEADCVQILTSPDPAWIKGTLQVLLHFTEEEQREAQGSYVTCPRGEEEWKSEHKTA